MPIYEFHCENCGNRFETLVRNQEEHISCDQCGGSELKKLISVPAIGSGSPDTPCGSAPCSPAPACGSGGCQAFG